jgi:hypothetical protein
MPAPIQLPEIPDAERSPLVERLAPRFEALAQETCRQAETIQQLRDEIAVLKGEKAKPTFKPSGMERETDPDPDRAGDPPAGTPAKRAGSTKRSKTAQLAMHEECRIPPSQALPPGARFKRYRDFVVQNLKIQPYNIRYRLEVWQSPDGPWRCGELPATLQGGHFGPGLRT